MISFIKKKLIRPIVNSASPEFCEHILDRALFEKWDVQKIHEPFILDLPIPKGCEDDPSSFAAFTAHQRTGFQAQYLVCIPDGIAAGGGFVRLPSGEFLTESTWRIAYMLGDMGADVYRSRYRRHKLYLKGDYYYLDMLFSGNYGHWFSDELPRLITALPFLPKNAKFIISDPIQDYKVKSLEAFGITSDQLLPVKGYYEIHCERLWFATPLGSCEWASTAPEVFRKMGALIAEYHKNALIEPLEKIFISRDRLSYKRLTNEIELLEVIKDSGFTVVNPEKLSFVQQVNTFSRSKFVLGTYGAGITNILFSQRPLCLMELQNSVYAPRRWYWKLATMLGQSYSSLVGKTVNDTPEWDVHFTIDPDCLRDFINEQMIFNNTSCKRWWSCN
jgi:capsular polysaccharide biosynthesis protein